MYRANHNHRPYRWYIQKILPDSIGNFADLLPVLDIGEAIAVGDASLFPSRIMIDLPNQKLAVQQLNFGMNGAVKMSQTILERLY